MRHIEYKRRKKPKGNEWERIQAFIKRCGVPPRFAFKTLKNLEFDKSIGKA